MEQLSNRGRSTLHITEEVAQSHRLSRQRHDTNHVTGNVLREASQAGPAASEPPPQTSTVAAQAPSKKRGRPRVVVTEDVLEQRRLAKQRRNARRSKKNVLGEISHRDAASELPTTKNSATENVLGQSSRGDATFELPTTNKSAPATGAPFKKRGRPRVAITNDGLDQRRLSSQMRNARSAEKNVLRPASHADASSEAHPPTNCTGEGEVPPQKRGRPRLPVTGDVLERRRLSKRRRNAYRRKNSQANVPSESTPALSMTESVLRDVPGANNTTELSPAANSIRGRKNGETPRRRKHIDREKKKFDLDSFRSCCFSEANQCLYGFTDQHWEVKVPDDQFGLDFPHPKPVFYLDRHLKNENNWLTQVSVESDSWLYSIAFYYIAERVLDAEDGAELLKMLNKVPPIYEVAGFTMQPTEWDEEDTDFA